MKNNSAKSLGFASVFGGSGLGPYPAGSVRSYRDFVASPNQRGAP
jgi:hypothetical protein